jgi:pimeloyl-ACP methyl ester carboxylesterase
MQIEKFFTKISTGGIALIFALCAQSAAQDLQQNSSTNDQSTLTKTEIEVEDQKFKMAWRKSTSGSESAIFYLHGDVTRYDAKRPESELLNPYKAWLDKASRDNKLDIFFIARPGYLGSDGDSKNKRSKLSLQMIAKIIEKLQNDGNYKNIAVWGHSGGGSAAVGLLSVTNLKFSCIVAASAGYHLDILRRHRPGETFEVERYYGKDAVAEYDAKVYDAAKYRSLIKIDPRRRIILMGDPRDSLAPFESSVLLANDLLRDGHNVDLKDVIATDYQHHNTVAASFYETVKCLRSVKD